MNSALKHSPRLLLALGIVVGVWVLATRPLDYRSASEIEKDPTAEGTTVPLIGGKVELPWRWGMDFNGGVRLVYELKHDKVAAMKLSDEEMAKRLEQSRKRLRERVVAFHSEETKVALLGETRILVEVPGVRDIQRVKREVGKPQYLTVRGVLETSPDVEAAEGWYPLSQRDGGGSVRLSEPGTRGEHILFNEFEEVEDLQDHRFGFSLPLTLEGQDISAEFTTRFAGGQIAIVLDDDVRDLLYVQEGGIRTPMITTSRLMDAVRLKKLLKSGPLPLPFELVQQRAVSPILAATAETSMKAMLLGILLLVTFFGLNYLHRPYFLLVALLAVALEVGLFVIVANQGWVRISLAQLAGLALLIGMSVDAFILVFEHIERSMAEDEEGLASALEHARKAFRTEFGVIFWASLTTILSLGGLFFVEGILHEYFVLLALGVAISLAAALYLRLLMGTDLLVAATSKLGRDKPFAPWLSWIRGVDLIAQAGRMTRAYTIAVPVSLLIIGVFVATGRVELGIDFSGGAQIVVQTDQEVSAERLREIADDQFDARCEVQLSKAGEDEALGSEAPHYTIRVPEVIEELVSRAEGVAPVHSGVAEPKMMEAQLLRAIETELGVQANLVEVELLGSAAALDNVFSSLQNAVWGLAVLFALCALLYISLRVPFWIVLALSVDVILVMGVIMITGLPVDYPMIAAFLTFAGYSINDSIVVCHMIRETGKAHMPEMVRASDPELPGMILNAIGHGLRPLSSRVMLTSLTTMLTMVPLIFCEGVLHTFGVIFVVGVGVGTLSSIYVVGVHARDVVMGDTQTV